MMASWYLQKSYAGADDSWCLMMILILMLMILQNLMIILLYFDRELQFDYFCSHWAITILSFTSSLQADVSEGTRTHAICGWCQKFHPEGDLGIERKTVVNFSSKTTRRIWGVTMECIPWMARWPYGFQWFFLLLLSHCCPWIDVGKMERLQFLGAYFSYSSIVPAGTLGWFRIEGYLRPRSGFRMLVGIFPWTLRTSLMLKNLCILDCYIS